MIWNRQYDKMLTIRRALKLGKVSSAKAIKSCLHWNKKWKSYEGVLIKIFSWDFFSYNGGIKMKAKILKAKQEDAIQIASLIKNGWNAAYKGIISDEFLRNMDEKKLVGNWLKSIENGENNYVYKMNNEILGIIRFGKAERPVTPNEGEVYVLYVKVEEKRKGIGTELLTFAKQELKQNGFNKMIIWCLKEMFKAQIFTIKMKGLK